MGKLIELAFGRETVADPTSRNNRLEQLARTSANLLLGAVNGDIDDIEENTDFLASIIADFDPPLTQGEIDAAYRRAIIMSKEINLQKKGA